MAESLLLPVLRAAAGKASDVLVQNVTRMWGIDDDCRKLELHLVAIQCKLVDAETKSKTNPSIKIWMKHLRSIAYKADDILDDFQYEALHREAHIGEYKARKVLSHFTNHNPLLFRLTMSRKLHNILKKINDLVTEMNMFGLKNRVEAPPVLCRHTHSALDKYAQTFGRDNDKEEVVKLLLAQQNEQKVHVLPIFGMGGLGKTTLAKMVYNDRKIRQHFQLKLWHCVSDNFDVVAILKSIIEVASSKKSDVSDNIELLRRKLEEEIGGKRFLLILDDVWNENERKWNDDLKPLLGSVGGLGSVIVVTCRSQQVAKIMGTIGPHKLECVSEDDSWELFKSKAFTNGLCEQKELETIGKSIVKKCRGLPLALNTIRGLMSSKEQVHEWKAVEESNIGDNPRGVDDIISILKLSYNHLPSEMKLCFSFCAFFPKDYEMIKDILIQLWMANGFIQEEETMDLVQKGEYVFQYLVWTSFLQDVKENENDLSVSCKMHHLMHDLAKDVANDCATIEEAIQQKALFEDIRHMFIGKKFELEQNNRVFKEVSLRTLFVSSISEWKLMDTKLMVLRALCCIPPSTIRSQVIKAKHLRYLDFSESQIVQLPDSICMLYNLQTLRLNRCNRLKQLPEGITALRKLIHLHLFGCSSLERMPLNISLLNNLYTLTMFIVETEPGRGIEELKDLCHLGNRLELYNLSKINSVQNAKNANLHEKPNVTELALFWGLKKSDQPEDESCIQEEVLVLLRPHCKLRELEVHGYGGSEISQWMRDPRMFMCLTKLTISNCTRCKYLPIVWLSGSLEYLYVKNMTSLITLCNTTTAETKEHFFPKLKKMVLCDLPNLKRWVENCGEEPNRLFAFHCLEVLEIENCRELSSVPESPVLKTLNIEGVCNIPMSSLAHLTTMSELMYNETCSVFISMPIFSWPSLETLIISSLASMKISLEDQQSQKRPLEKLRNLRLKGSNCFVTTSGLSKSHLLLWDCFASVETLTIHNCNDLIDFPSEELQRLLHLRSLTIMNCENLGKGSCSGELFFSQLEILSIAWCPSLVEIPKPPPSLKRVEIWFCKNIVGLPDGLTSLEELTIWDCRGMSEFPQGLLQRLPALKSLWICYCSPELHRRCRAGGEYFHLLSSIPDRYIPEPEETGSSCMKKCLKKLLPLPSCGGSN